MTVFFNDTFTEASTGDVALDTHVPETGTGWTGTDAGAAGVLKLDRSNDDVKASTGTGHGVISDSVPANNYEVSCSGRTGSTGSNRYGVILRWDEPGDNGYEGRIRGDGVWEIREVTAGVATVLNSGNVSAVVGSFSVATNYTIMVRARGTSLKLFINGTLAGSATNGNWTGGSVGITCSGTAPRITSFSADSILPIGITGVTPDSGTTAGGDTINLLFSEEPKVPFTVTFGGGSATSITYAGPGAPPNELWTCVNPAHAAGTVDVVITGSDEETITLANEFTYTSSGGGGSSGSQINLSLLGVGA